ncbi:MAG: DsbA family oxidoreductase [Candidatus Eiseniibacteriota bacterium]
MIRIDIVSDTVCPWCFIGKRRLEAALQQHGDGEPVTIVWRPFQLNPEMPEGGLDRREYLEAKFGGPAGAKQVYDRIRQAGQSAGLELNFEAIPRTPNTVNSHRLIHRATALGKQNEIVEALFRAYFLEGRDIGSIDTLVEYAASVGLPEAEIRAYLESDEDAELIRGLDAQARQMGIQGVPCFIFNNQYAVSGAQEPAIFLQVFDILKQEAAKAEAEPAESSPN